VTADTPASSPDAPASADEASRPLAAGLLTASPLPVTTAGPAAADPKLPPFRGD
jgi:hypothetical protein